MNSVLFAHLASGRDNNFNLMRFIAASLVVLTHAYGLTGNATGEPLLRLAGLSLGSLAVDVFFVISGFLIAKSWVSRNDPIGFFYARFMRIYPALWVSVFFCGFILGPAFTTLPLKDYFTHIDTLKFLLENTTLLIAGTFKTLPGVFADLPSPDINAPLWTLPYELKMYIGLALLGSLGILKRPVLILALVLIGYAGFVFAWLHPNEVPERITDTLRFVYLFFAGSTIYLYRNRLRIGWLAFAACTLAALALPALLTELPAERRLILALFCPPLVLMAAFLPKGPIRAFNRFGDYSYGIYIFGMPVQQSLIALTGGTSPTINFALSYSLTLLLAITSWHLLEKQALAMPLPGFLTRAGAFLRLHRP